MFLLYVLFVIFVLCIGYTPDDTFDDTNGKAHSIIRRHSVAFDGSLLRRSMFPR